MAGGALVSGFSLHSARHCEVVTRKFYTRKLSSLNMDDSSQDQYISLKNIIMAVKSQGDVNVKLRQ